MRGIQAENLNRLFQIKHRFMGRKGGTSPRPWDYLNTSYDVGDVQDRVDENRTRICAVTGILKTALYTPKQVHGTKAIRVSKQNSPGEIAKIEADAIWTTETGILVGVQTADCAPILFASEEGEVVGAIHAGWRGAVKQIALSTLKEVSNELKLKPHHFRIAIGPCIGYDSFEVESEVIDEVKKTVSSIKDIVKEGKEGKFLLDLAGMIKLQLLEHHYTNVETLGICTVLNSHDYFSFRKSHSKCGRQLSVICKN